MVLKLENVDFGAPDANAEFMLGVKSQKNPIFIDAYIAPPLSEIEKFRLGQKFLILGLKGTGKTAILRELQQKAKLQDYRDGVPNF